MSDDLRGEYQFDYSKAKPNRFAAALQKGGRLVVLDPEVAAAFRESGTVNAVLRALLHAGSAGGGGGCSKFLTSRAVCHTKRELTWRMSSRLSY